MSVRLFGGQEIGSVLDNHFLCKETFESAVCFGMSEKEILTLFSQEVKNIGELDKWCMETYKMPFSTVYELLQVIAVDRYLETPAMLGIKGNPSAIQIMNEMILKRKTNSVVSINFNCNLPEENEDDKENDE